MHCRRICRQRRPVIAVGAVNDASGSGRRPERGRANADAENQHRIRPNRFTLRCCVHVARLRPGRAQSKYDFGAKFRMLFSGLIYFAPHESRSGCTRMSYALRTKAAVARSSNSRMGCTESKATDKRRAERAAESERRVAER